MGRREGDCPFSFKSGEERHYLFLLRSASIQIQVGLGCYWDLTFMIH